jgi:plasmid maintenance system antidote protein VapI
VTPFLHSGITPSTALRLSKFFGVSAVFWMNLQLRWDLYFAQESETEDLRNIKPISPKKILFNEPSTQPGAGQ